MNGLYGQVLFRETIDQCVSGWGQKRGKFGKKLCTFMDPKHCTIQICLFVRRAKMGQHLQVGSAASKFLTTQVTLCASCGDKLNICSFILFWLNCWIGNLNSFPSKLATFLSCKHLSHTLCALTSPQLCLLFYRGGVTG